MSWTRKDERGFISLLSVGVEGWFQALEDRNRKPRQRRDLWKKQVFGLDVILFSHHRDTHVKMSSMIFEECEDVNLEFRRTKVKTRTGGIFTEIHVCIFTVICVAEQPKPG